MNHISKILKQVIKISKRLISLCIEDAQSATENEIKLYLLEYFKKFDGKSVPNGKALDIFVHQVRCFEAVSFLIYDNHKTELSNN